VVAYEDVWGTVTVPSYEAKTGRVLSTTTTPPGGAPIVQTYAYDADGKVLSVKMNDTLFADPAYASDQLLQSAAYANGTSLASITRDSYTGATIGMQWAFADASTVSDAVVRSQSGRIIQNTLTDTASAGPETATYRFDAAGRLVRAEVPRHVLEYGFGAGVCGMIGSAAGANGNRTSFSDTFDGGTPTTVA